MFKWLSNVPSLGQLSDSTTSSGRLYVTPDGASYPSVTTVIGYSKRSAINAWRDKVGNDQADKISSQASFRGTQFHTLAERYLQNDRDWKREIQPVNLSSFIPVKRLLDQSVDNIYYQEAALYSDLLRTAGRLDLLAEWNGTLSIVDFKTSRKEKKREWLDGYFLQGSFYAAALYERTGLIAKQAVIVMVIDDIPEPAVFIEPTFDWLPKFIQLRREYDERVIHG